MIRVLSVDDHPLLREGIAALVGNQPDMELVAEASNGREALEQFRKYRPDITLMDLRLPGTNGTDTLIAIRGEFPVARIIMLTTSDGDLVIQRALRAGGRKRHLAQGGARRRHLIPIASMRGGAELQHQRTAHAQDRCAAW